MQEKESQHIELKESWRDDYLKILSAFANTAGGKLYVGIRDDGTVCGIKNSEKLLEDLPNKIINILGIHANIHVLEKDTLKYLEIEVTKSPYPVSYQGRFYIRSGSTTQELKGSALQQLLLTTNNLTWDEITVSDALWDEIDTGAVRMFTRKALQVNRLSPDVDENNIKEVFENLGLSKNGILTRASLLLFAKKPTRYCSLGVCKIGRFRGNSHVDLITDDVIECPLFQMPDRIMELLIAKYLQKNFTYSGLQRVETLEYPEAALREAILNAVIHRDYGGNTFFTVKIFDNSLEFWNEGELMSPLRIELLKMPHFSRLRNKLMAHIFYRSGQIEAWGRGTIKILEDARKGDYPEPEFEEFQGGILVRFEKKILTEELQVPNFSKIKHADKILDLIRKNPKVTIPDMADNLSVTSRTVERVLSKLVQGNILDREGPNKNGEWIIIIDLPKMLPKMSP